MVPTKSQRNNKERCKNLPPFYFVHVCPSFVPKNPSLMKSEWSAESNRGVPICDPSPPSISLSLSLFILHNSLSPISFTSIQPIALFCPAEVSSSLSLSLPPSSPLFHFVLHLSISYFQFFLNLFFSLLFLSCARSSSRVPAATPAALPPLLCAKLWVFFLKRDGKTGREEG